MVVKCDACGLVIVVLKPENVLKRDSDKTVYKCDNCNHVIHTRIKESE